MDFEQDKQMLINQLEAIRPKRMPNLAHWEHESTLYLIGYRPWLPKTWGICLGITGFIGWIFIGVGEKERLSVMTALGGSLFTLAIIVSFIASDVMRQTLLAALNDSIVALYIESRRQVIGIQSWSNSEVAFFWAIRSGGKRPGWLAMRLDDGSGVDLFLTGSNWQLRKVADILNARLHHK